MGAPECCRHRGAHDDRIGRMGAARLHEIRRFAEAWEVDASLALRRRDPAALSEYAMRARIHSGTTTHIEAELFDAWRADALGACASNAEFCGSGVQHCS
jgi:hypothetical protein